MPLSAVGVMVAKSLTGDANIGDVVWAGVSVAFTVTIQLVFWFTVVFAIVERTEGKGIGAAPEWTPDHLPALPVPGRISLVEVALSVAGLVFAAVFIVWQQVAAPIVIDGQAYPVLDPALWSFWLPWFLVVIGLEAVFTGALYLRGRWTWSFAVVNALLAAASAIPAIWLIQTDQLLEPSGRRRARGPGCRRRHRDDRHDHRDLCRRDRRLGRRRRLPQGVAQREIGRGRHPPDPPTAGCGATAAANGVASRQRSRARGDAPCAIAWPASHRIGLSRPGASRYWYQWPPRRGDVWSGLAFIRTDRTDPDERGAP